MPSSKVDICNATLGKLGQDIRIVSLSENTKHARALNACFDRVLDYVLTDLRPPFATRSLALALDAQAAIGWEYRYAYPADCLDALLVCDENGARSVMGSVSMGACFDLDRAYRLAWPVPYTVLHGDQSTSIATDLEAAYLIYIVRIEDTGRFPVLFNDAFIARLAIEVAPVLAAEVGLRLGPQLEQKYIAAKDKAMAHAMNEGKDDPDPVTPSIAARGA